MYLKWIYLNHAAYSLAPRLTRISKVRISLMELKNTLLHPSFLVRRLIDRLFIRQSIKTQSTRSLARVDLVKKDCNKTESSHHPYKDIPVIITLHSIAVI